MRVGGKGGYVHYPANSHQVVVSFRTAIPAVDVIESYIGNAASEREAVGVRPFPWGVS